MDEMPLYPVAMRLEGRACLVIGNPDDREATQKAKALAECGASVRRIHDYQTIRDSDVAGVFLVLSTVRDEAVSQRLQHLSERHGFLLWCMDQPCFGSISMMAIAKSGPVRLAVSTSGAAPSISKTFRKSLERAMDPKFGRFITQLASLRDGLRRRMPRANQAQERIGAILEASRNFEVRISFQYPDWFEKPELVEHPEAE